jgi:hypothetical protein
MQFLETLQYSAFAMWVAGESLLAYPTILTAHTLGLAVVVGASTLVDLRILGLTPGIPFAELDKMYRPMWIGFAINLVSGLCLFAAGATNFGLMRAFYLKLACVGGGLIIAVRLRRLVVSRPGSDAEEMPAHARALAALSLVFWAGAIVTGRLMAYLTG